MLKKNGGVTLVALIITVIILMILAGVSIQTGGTTVKDVRVSRILANMTMVRAKAETIYEEYLFSNNDESKLPGTQVQLGLEVSQTEKDIIVDNARENAESVAEFDTWKWYQWTSDTLSAQGLNADMLNDNESFYVNYEYGEVLYSKGTSYDNTNYYYSMSGLDYIHELN